MRVCAAYPNVNVKVVGTHSGISIGEDGPSQMSIEEIGLACSLPNFVVIAPADEASTKALVHAAAAHVGPVFIRTGSRAASSATRWSRNGTRVSRLTAIEARSTLQRMSSGK